LSAAEPFRTCCDLLRQPGQRRAGRWGWTCSRRASSSNTTQKAT